MRIPQTHFWLWTATTKKTMTPINTKFTTFFLKQVIFQKHCFKIT